MIPAILVGVCDIEPRSGAASFYLTFSPIGWDLNVETLSVRRKLYPLGVGIILTLIVLQCLSTEVAVGEIIQAWEEVA